MMKIAPDVHYLSRDEWGADPALPRLGEVRPASEPTEAIQHHTVISDTDDTPLFWESVAEVIPAMQRLQTIRPNLGLDVPYSFVGFLMQYAHKPGLIICEGRGAYRRGAHTKYHNRTGRAMAIQGNTMGEDVSASTEMLGWGWGWIKDHFGLVNLGTTRPARAEMFGHRDFRRDDDTTTWTVCPGDGAYNALPAIRIDRWQPAQEDEEMFARIIHIKDDTTPTNSYLWRPGLPRLHMKSREQRWDTAALYGISREPVLVSQATLDAL